MSSRKRPPSQDSTDAAASTDAPDSLRERLQSASREQLVSLIERLASHAPEIAERIEYLTDPGAAVKTLQRRINTLRNGKSFVDWRGVREVAHEIESIRADIEHDVLPSSPARALALAEKLFSLDQKIFNRADDSSGHIGGELREACVLWLRAAAALRAADGDRDTDWVKTIYDLYNVDDYGIRERLLRNAHLLLSQLEMRALAARFEHDTRQVLSQNQAGDAKSIKVFGPASAMGLVAEALRDPALHERSIRLYSPEPNDLQSEDIAKCYLDCEDAEGALSWLQHPWREDLEHRRLGLLDRAYGMLGDLQQQIAIRREHYRRAPSIHTYRALEELLPPPERAALRADACATAESQPDVAVSAQLLFSLDEPALAEDLIVHRSGELDGRFYGSLLELADVAKSHGRMLAATLLWRALLNAILDRAYAKAYGHGAAYLRELHLAASAISDYRGHPSHREYEQGLRAQHGRKASFWSRAEAGSE